MGTFDAPVVIPASFTFQLNAYGATRAQSGWQQHGFQLNSSEISGLVNNWPANPTASPPEYFELDTFSLASLPRSALPAGYELTVARTYDGGASVPGATYTVGSGGTSTTVSQTLTSMREAVSGLSPIIAFEVNLVGAVAPAQSSSRARRQSPTRRLTC